MSYRSGHFCGYTPYSTSLTDVSCSGAPTSLTVGLSPDRRHLSPTACTSPDFARKQVYTFCLEPYQLLHYRNRAPPTILRGTTLCHLNLPCPTYAAIKTHRPIRSTKPQRNSSCVKHMLSVNQCPDPGVCGNNIATRVPGPSLLLLATEHRFCKAIPSCNQYEPASMSWQVARYSAESDATAVICARLSAIKRCCCEMCFRPRNISVSRRSVTGAAAKKTCSPMLRQCVCLCAASSVLDRECRPLCSHRRLRRVERRLRLHQAVRGDVAVRGVPKRPVDEQRAAAASARCILYVVCDVDAAGCLC